MLVRNVGHLMTIDAILDRDGKEVPEGILDALFTALIAKHDLLRTAGRRNSRAGSVYIVQPTMHGPQEDAFADEPLARAEDAIRVARDTLKLGIMDWAARRPVNPPEVIRAAQPRMVRRYPGLPYRPRPHLQ